MVQGISLEVPHVLIQGLHLTTLLFGPCVLEQKLEDHVQGVQCFVLEIDVDQSCGLD